MRNSHLVFIMVFLLIVIVIGMSSIIAVVRSHPLIATLPSKTANMSAPTITVVLSDPTRSDSVPVLSPHEGTAIPFHMSSLDTHFAMVGTLTGSFIIHQDTIEVTIDEGEAHFVSKNASRSVFTEIMACIGYTIDGKVYSDSFSPRVSVTSKPTSDGKYILHSMTFSISRALMKQDKPYLLYFQLINVPPEGEQPTREYACPVYDFDHPFYLPTR